ncbi:MAG: Bifunctional protein FolD [Parcubacteria group bacterium GW2011_GWC1_43_12]|nr:MAG: Bifunctional protein FolD [Parcubacteria group bacterium GW2011_GWC1_43_12]
MNIFDGKKVAEKIKKEIAKEIKAKNLKPKLAVILIGDDEASKIYVRLKKQAGEKIGIKVEEYDFSSRAREDDIIVKINELNKAGDAHGIIVQLPLPAVFNTDRIIESIDPKKDADGFHKENLKILQKGRCNFLPVLPLAILLALREGFKNNLSGKSALAFVNSEIFGQVLKTILQKEGLGLKYLVRNTCLVFGAEDKLKKADAVITVTGCPNMIKGDMIKDGAVLVDAGITRYHDGKIIGDVDRESVAQKAAFLTPTPGGIGPVTVALLLRNVYLAALALENKK